MKLVIVESPSKAKTIKRYLGKDYEVLASKGHIRDLPVSKFGVDLDTLEAEYEILSGKQKTVKELKNKAKGKEVFLASDNDREGEAIAWHVSKVLELPEDGNNRIVFNEITKNAIQKAIKSPKKINMNMVDAQFARRVLDRIVGYKISPMLWKILQKGLSAGRVQSVALRFIVELENKISDFISHDYYKFFMKFNNEKIPLVKYMGKKVTNNTFVNDKEKDEIFSEMKDSKYEVSKISRRTKTKKQPFPFTTSTLQQTAINTFGWSAKRTMQVAQKLYEGIETDEGNIAFITYMRTDSTRISDEAKSAARDFINKIYGDKYIGSQKEKKVSNKIQDAHEAIRPTYVDKTPDTVKKNFSKDEYKLYNLIWTRFIASQMSPSKYDVLKVDICDEKDKFLFQFSVEKVIFDGHEVVYNKNLDEREFPNLKEGQEIVPDEIISEKDQTKPPARYSEASLVKELESKGIGRPSTFATIISTLLNREYIKKEGRELKPTLLGNVVSDFLTNNFSNIINSEFTSNLETELDKVENNSVNWKKVIKDFYRDFSLNLDEINKRIKEGKLKIVYKTNLKCDCGGEYKLIFGRYGGYLKCEKCEKNKSLDMMSFAPINKGIIDLKNLTEKKENNLLDEKCPKCGKPLALKNGRFGEFIACTGYPDCKYTRNVQIEAPCPKCGGKVSKLKSKKGKIYFKCNDCDEMFWKEPSGKKCEECGEPLYIKNKKTGKVLYCDKCKTEYKMDDDEE